MMGVDVTSGKSRILITMKFKVHHRWRQGNKTSARLSVRRRTDVRLKESEKSASPILLLFKKAYFLSTRTL